MVELFYFFPFDMGPGFAGVFVLISVGLMLIGTVVRNQVARAIDERSKPKHLAPSTLTGAPTQGEPSPPLAVGVLPRGEQVWMVAWLRAGEAGVVQTLLAAAGAEGWLTSSNRSPFLRFIQRGAPRDDMLAAFYDRLERTEEEDLSVFAVYSLACAVAQSMEPKLRHEAVMAGMVRKRSGHWLLVVVMLLFGVLAEALAVIHLVVHAAQHPEAPVSAFLIIAMLVVGTVFIVLATLRPGSYVAKRYLEWLDDATLSLVSDVGAGRRQDPADVTLAAAMAGLSPLSAALALGSIGLAYEVANYVPPTTSTTSSYIGDGGMGP